MDLDVLVFELHEEADQRGIGFREGIIGKFLEEIVAEEGANELEDGTGWQTGQFFGMIAHGMELCDHVLKFTGMEVTAEASGDGGEGAEGRFGAGARTGSPSGDGGLDFGKVQFGLEEHFVQCSQFFRGELGFVAVISGASHKDDGLGF